MLRCWGGFCKGKLGHSHWFRHDICTSYGKLFSLLSFFNQEYFTHLCVQQYLLRKLLLVNATKKVTYHWNIFIGEKKELVSQLLPRTKDKIESRVSIITSVSYQYILKHKNDNIIADICRLSPSCEYCIRLFEGNINCRMWQSTRGK